MAGFGAIVLGLMFPASLTATATELPPTVMSYLREKDAGVKVRFDGMVTFPNGMVYLPIFPQDPSMSENPSQILNEAPTDKPYPDLIHFDNNLFLIRLINTASGKLALAKLEMYPIELKEGLLPQDLLLPPNLYIPTELKVILGDLPYDPQASQDVVADTPEAIAQKVFDTARHSPVKKTLYLTDLDRQTLVVIDPEQGMKKETVELNCVASRVIPSEEGHAVYVSCLTTDELVVVDTFSNLVKARVAVGSKPTGVLYVEGEDQLLVSHRFSNFLTVVSTVELVGTSKILLPGNGGEMLRSHWNWHVYVADYTAGKVYDLDLVSQQVVRTLPGLKNISAMWLDERDRKKTTLWMASRSSHQVMAMDLETGEPLAVIDVGKKPVSFAPLIAKDQLYVLSAGNARLDVIDLKTKTRAESRVILEPGSFPTALAVSEVDEKAYVTTAGTDQLFVVDLKNGSVETALPLDVRAMGLTLLGEKTAEKASTEKPEASEESSSESEEGMVAEPLEIQPPKGNQQVLEDMPLGPEPRAVPRSKLEKAVQKKTPPAVQENMTGMSHPQEPALREGVREALIEAKRVVPVLKRGETLAE